MLKVPGTHPAVSSIFRWIFLFAMVALVLFPGVVVLLGGFKSAGDLHVNPLGPPQVWRWTNYADILATRLYWHMMLNSLLLAAGTVAVTVTVSASAALALLRGDHFGERLLSGYLCIGLTMPAASLVLPLFLQTRDLSLQGTLTGLILPQSAFALGAAFLLLRNHFRSLPREVMEAAIIDGCNEMQYFLFFILPLSGPTLATVGVITFIASWNGYLLPLVMLDRPELFPWPLGMMYFATEHGSSSEHVLAFVSLSLLPSIAVFVFAQRYVVEGIASGALKG